MRKGFLFLLLALLGAASDEAEEWRACREAALAKPGSWSCHCFYSLARKSGDWERARRELATLGAAEDDPYWLFTRGRVEDAATGCAGSEPLFRRAAEIFAAAGEGQGETWSRGNLLRCLERHDLAAARREGEKLFALAERTGDPKLIAIAALRKAQVALSALDFSAAEALLTEYSLAKLDALDPSSELGLEWLVQHLRLNQALGRLEDARRDAEERIARAEKRQDPPLLARVSFDAAMLATQLPPTADNRQAARAGAKAALAAAERGGDLGVLAPALLLQGRLENDAALLARCGELARKSGNAEILVGCRFAEAATVAAVDPPLAERLLAEGEAAGRAADDPFVELLSWSDRLRAIFALRPRQEALAAARGLLAEVEKVRAAEASGARRAEVFGVWRELHDWLAGRLLESGDPAEAELAFALLEEARARVLRETLGERLGTAAPARPLTEIASGLAADEALLSFQLDHERDHYGHPDSGGAVFVTTRDSTRVLRLPDRGRVEPAIAILLGDIGGRRESPELARRLGELLFDPIAAVLPAGTSRLIVVPDGPLFQLPWPLLRDPGGRLLAERYEFVLAPAASLPSRQGESGTGGALILADPAFPDAARLPRLPHAEIEGREVRRLLGGELWQDAAANEPRFRGADLAPYALVHFAAHAVLDDERPERSALLLAPGESEGGVSGSGGDGRLDPREIAALRLAGKMVTLASCRSAGGRVLPGEGPMSLGRAFLAAGAPAVLGSLWPLRDDEAEAFFGRFYRRLAAGEKAAAALAATQRELAAQGEPAAAWAGVVLLGDGDFRLAPRSRLGQLARSPGQLALLGVLAAAAIAAACLFLRHRRLRV